MSDCAKCGANRGQATLVEPCPVCRHTPLPRVGSTLGARPTLVSLAVPKSAAGAAEPGSEAKTGGSGPTLQAAVAQPGLSGVEGGEGSGAGAPQSSSLEAAKAATAGKLAAAVPIAAKAVAAGGSAAEPGGAEPAAGEARMAPRAGDAPLLGEWSEDTEPSYRPQLATEVSGVLGERTV